MSKTGKSIFAGSIAFILFGMLRQSLPVKNMVFFVIMCVVFAAVCAGIYLIADKVPVMNGTNPKSEKIWSILPAASLVVWMVLFYVNETNTEHGFEVKELVRRYLPLPVWLLIIAVGVLSCLWILRKEPKEKTLKIRTVIRSIVTLLFAAATAAMFYAPNIFKDIQGGTYHSHAYTNSILNVCWLTPYYENMQSLYGHYAIFYMPVLKGLHRFFRIDYLTGIFMMTAVIAGISILLFAYVLNYFAKHDLIYYLGLLAIGEKYFMQMQGGVYMQVHPHRMIFPILILALALQEHRKAKKYNVFAVLLIALSIVWSTEVGMVIMFAFSLYRWVWAVMDGEKLTAYRILLLLQKLAVFAVIPFMIAYLIVAGYNRLAAGVGLSMREFLFPLISDRGYIGNIELVLPDVTHAWIGASVLFLSVLALTMLQILFPQKKESENKPFYFLLSIMSLGLMLYYINRPTEGSMFIVLFSMLILQAIILEKSQQIYQEWKSEGKAVFAKPDGSFFLALRVITTLILFAMAFDSVYSIPKAWKTAEETVWQTDDLEEFAQYIWVQIPPDAMAFGEGVPELMAMIDRDTHLHTTEWSYKNMPLDTMEDIRYELEDEQWFFCNLASLWEMQSYYPGLTDHFYLHEEFEYNGAKFAFYRKTE